MPTHARIVTIYTIAAVYAGIAGALLATTTQFVSLDVLALRRSAEVLLVLIVGGTGWLYGGLIGALVIKVLQDQFADLTQQYWEFWLGLVLVLIVLIGRDRIAGLWRFRWIPRPMSPALETIDLEKRFGGLVAAARVSLTPRKAEPAMPSSDRTGPARRR